MPRSGHALQYDYRSPRSDIGSSTTGRYPYDSGYGGSKSFATKSVRSADHLDQSPSSQSVAEDIRDLNFHYEPNFQDPSVPSVTSQNPQYASMDVSSDAPQSPTVTFDLTCQYQSCGVVSKNQSEHRKHLLRHEKPHKCDISGCSKVDGFSTNNDLDRHKKSVHKIMPKNSTDRSFRCAAINCPKKEKIWPRLDNFRQHCLRIHPDEECDELVKKSAMEANELANSSNHVAGDTGPGADIDELTDYLNPSITFNYPMNMMPFHCGVDPRMQQAQHFRSLSPHSPEISSLVTRYVPFSAPPVPDQLLQVPEPNSPGNRPISPSRKALPDSDNVTEPSYLGESSKKGPKSKPLASTKKAEQISEELASEIAQRIDFKGQSENIQAAIKETVLFALNPSLSRKRTAQMASLKEDLGPHKKKIICSQCPVTTARQCDMKYIFPYDFRHLRGITNEGTRKHEKRHTRPYGCTFPGCSKKLGSKNDWKRHENTQHYQIETWRCHEASKSSAIGQCASIFYRREQFQGHLRDKHQIQDDKRIQEQCTLYRIGRNGQGKFWCGFCQKIIELKKKGLEAWEERFGHIDDLHYKKGQTIYDWVPLDGHFSKGLMAKGDYVDYGAKDDEYEDYGEDNRSTDDDEGGGRQSQKSTPNSPSPRLGAEGVTYSARVGGSSRGSFEGQTRPRRRETIWYCLLSSSLPVLHSAVNLVVCSMSGHPQSNHQTSLPFSYNGHASTHPVNTSASEKIQEEDEDDEANGNRETDIKKKQTFKGRYLFWLAYQSIGVIYGDIGTSPLYVYSSTFTSDPSYDDLLGALSLIIWTVTLMVSIKYVLIVLRADDEGEGGTFAIYSLLSRYNLIKHDHSVLKAFSPAFAGQYLVRNKTDGWKSLGGILLAFTGVEALFADLAYISDNPEAYSNPFFNAVPPGMFYPSLVVAVLASLVASQTMVTATFQLLSQIIKLSYFPQVKLVHTSKIFHGQVYIPWVNWLLMIGTIIVTVAYNNTTKLGQAYGVCVILVTFITTCMVSLVAVIVWQLPLLVVLLGFLILGALDGVYLSSALTKVPDGAWFTLLLATLLSTIFVLWRFGKENQWRAEASDRLAPSEIIDWNHADRLAVKDVALGLRFTHTFGSAPISGIKGLGIFFDKSGLPNTTPTVFIHFLQKFHAAPAVVVFFHIRPLAIPSVPLEERYTVTRCLGRPASNVKNQFFRVTLRHGYTDEVIHQDLGIQVYEQLRNFVVREGAFTGAARSLKDESTVSAPPVDAESILANSAIFAIPESSSKGQITIDQTTKSSGSSSPGQSDTGSADPKEQQDRVRRRLASLEVAYQDQVVYVVGKEQMRIQEVSGCKPRSWSRRIALAAFLWLRSNTGSKIANLNIDVDKLVEIGFVKVV
ncbi:MAG: hypothetical protein Q9171_003303 [Xanthocarpia ochracea]